MEYERDRHRRWRANAIRRFCLLYLEVSHKQSKQQNRANKRIYTDEQDQFDARIELVLQRDNLLVALVQALRQCDHDIALLQKELLVPINLGLLLLDLNGGGRERGGRA